MRTTSRSIPVLVTLGLLGVALAGAAVAADPASPPAASSGAPTAMQHMQSLHEKMMAAKTPAERQALMADHMKAMQEGMDAMQHMGVGAGSGKESGGMGMMRMRMDM